MVSISLFFHMILIQKICSFSKDHALTIQPRGQSSSTPAQPCIRNTKRLADVLFTCGTEIRHVRAMSDLPISDLPKTNALELSVSELSAALKRTVEDRFGFVRVRGEISNYRGPHSSGHAYFSLKDQSARIDAVIWKGVFAKLGSKPQEGLGSHRDRKSHNLSRQIHLSNHRRCVGASWDRRSYGARRGAPAETCGGRAFRRSAQAAVAVSAARA